MIRFATFTLLCTFLVHHCPATTLELLGFDNLIEKSTQVVRGRVAKCDGLYRGAMIYTQCTVTVVETLKGAPAAEIRFAVPGGRVGNIRQTIAGAPEFKEGAEYVLFLWTGSSNFTQVMGLSQGKFSVTGSGAQQTAVRDALSDVTMLDGMGQPVQDAGVRMTLNVLRQRVASRTSRSVSQ